MQRLKDEGIDPSNPDFLFDPTASTKPDDVRKVAVLPTEILMTKPGIARKIGAAELASTEAKDEAWFVVRGEVGA